MEKKNQVLMTVLGVFALVIVTVGVSYAFFTYTRTSTTTPTITTGSLDFGFTETASQKVTLEEALPVVDSVAEGIAATTQNVSVYNFKVAYHTSGDITTKYTLSLVDATADGDKDPAFNSLVKVALFRDTGSGSTNLGTKTLTEALASSWAASTTDVVVNNNDEHNYVLKMWVSRELAGFDATDNGSGELPGDDNYSSEDKQTATWKHHDKTVSIKVKVDAEGVANQNAQ